MTSFGEFDFIAELLTPLAGEGAFGLTDDAALLPRLSHGEAWTLTNDMMVGGVHFFPDDDPAMIARKLLRVNISDLAAMGAEPRHYLLALSADGSRDRDWFAGFCEGLKLDQDAFGIHLLGGDTTSTPGPMTLSLTAIGAVPRGQELRRNGARSGDEVWVTGTLGDAAMALHVLRDPQIVDTDSGDDLMGRYWLPQPSPDAGMALRGLATACMDISDGLVGDLGHIARHSGVGIEIEFDAVPLSAAGRAFVKACPAEALLPLHGGDDYELAFTLPRGVRPPDVDGVRFSRVGRVIDGEGVTVWRDGRIVTLEKAGWRHF